MTASSSGLRTRVLSAAIGILVLAGVSFWFKVTGLTIGCLAVSVCVAFEMMMLLYQDRKGYHVPVFIRSFFIVASLGVTLAVAFDPIMSIPALTIAVLTLLAVLMSALRFSLPLEDLFQLQTMSAMGVLYCGAIAGIVIRILNFPRGITWFYMFLGIVFIGDTFAFFAGRRFGKAKLLEVVSPKKTVSGSVGGMIGSLLTAIFFHFVFFPHTALIKLLILALLTNTFAQIGDLFESLVKRIARVKDSGNIMPGHGGLLDRVDGIYFSAPVYYLAAYLILHSL